MSSPQYSPLLVIIWILVVVSETSLLFVLFRQKSWRSTAAFTSFIAFCVLRSFLLLYAGFILNCRSVYSLIWWGAYWPQSVLLIAVVLEVIQIMFRPYDALPRGMLGNIWLAIFTVALLTTSFAVRFPGAQPSEWQTFLRAMDQGVSWTLLGIFAAISGFAGFLGIPWNHRLYGMVVGFVFYLLIDVVVVTMLAQVGITFGKYLWPVDMLAFLATCTGWTYCFTRAEVQRTVPTTDQVNRLAAVLSRYVFIIESLELKKCPKPMVLDDPAHLLLGSEER